MSQIFNIQDDKVVITKLALRYLEGTIQHAGQLSVVGPVNLGSNLIVNNTISADTITATNIKVKNLITDSGSLAESGNWAYNTEEDLFGKGFNWTHGNGHVRLVYREGGRLWTNGDIDLEATKSYKIDGVPVLSLNELGPQVSKSNLKELGNLKELTVTGPATIAEFAYFNNNNARLGINTDEPNGAISVVENDVELIVGSPNYGKGVIGTYTNHDVAIISDNTERLVVKRDGEVCIGNELSKTGVLRVFGKIYTDELVADTRLERTSPLDFQANRNGKIYNLGLQWTGMGPTRQLIMAAGPDRLWTSESFDLAENQSYYVNGKPVLSDTRLGETVTTSSLTSVGVLQGLTVQGLVNITGDLEVKRGTTTLKEVVFNDGVNHIFINNNFIDASDKISIRISEANVLFADKSAIEIGNKENTRRSVKVFGPLSVNVNNPDNSVDLEVQGDVKLGGKKFINGLGAPTQGTFSKGDICWNENPQEHNYVGWVCTETGSPGVWMPFGAISRQ